MKGKVENTARGRLNIVRDRFKSVEIANINRRDWAACLVEEGPWGEVLRHVCNPSQLVTVIGIVNVPKISLIRGCGLGRRRRRGGGSMVARLKLGGVWLQD